MNLVERQAEFQKEFELIKKFVPAIVKSKKLMTPRTMPLSDILIGYIDLRNSFSVSSKFDSSISLPCVIMDKLHEFKKLIDESLEGLSQYQQMRIGQATRNFTARNEGWCDGWDTGHATGTKIAEQKAELNSGNIYWDGFTEGLVQGKLEAELKCEEESLIKGLRKIFGG